MYDVLVSIQFTRGKKNAMKKLLRKSKVAS